MRTLYYFIQRGVFAGYWRPVPLQAKFDPTDLRSRLTARGYFLTDMPSTHDIAWDCAFDGMESRALLVEVERFLHDMRMRTTKDEVWQMSQGALSDIHTSVMAALGKPTSQD